MFSGKLANEIRAIQYEEEWGIGVDGVEVTLLWAYSNPQPFVLDREDCEAIRDIAAE